VRDRRFARRLVAAVAVGCGLLPGLAGLRPRALWRTVALLRRPWRCGDRRDDGTFAGQFDERLVDPVAFRLEVGEDQGALGSGDLDRQAFDPGLDVAAQRLERDDPLVLVRFQQGDVLLGGEPVQMALCELLNVVQRELRAPRVGRDGDLFRTGVTTLRLRCLSLLVAAGLPGRSGAASSPRRMVTARRRVPQRAPA